MMHRVAKRLSSGTGFSLKGIIAGRRVLPLSRTSWPEVGGLQRCGRLARGFSEGRTETEEEEFNRIFKGQKGEVDLEFRTYEVYFLRRDLEVLRRHIKTSVYLSGFLMSVTGGLYLFSTWTFGVYISAFISLQPLLRAILMWYRTRRVVSSIWLDPSKESLEVIYGTQLLRAKGPVEGIKPLQTHSLKSTTGFEVYFNFEDDLGHTHYGLNLYIDPRACEVDNLALLTKILAGQTEELKNFKFTGNEEDNKRPPS